MEKVTVTVKLHADDSAADGNRAVTSKVNRPAISPVVNVGVAAARHPPAGKVGAPKTGKKLFLAKGLQLHAWESFLTIRGCLPHAWESFLTIRGCLPHTCMGVFPYNPWMLTTCMGVFPYNPWMLTTCMGVFPYNPWLLTTCMGVFPYNPWMLTTCMGVFPYNPWLLTTCMGVFPYNPWMLTTCMGVFPYNPWMLTTFKVWFYIALYPVRWTAQSALHFPPLADLFIPTPFSASLGSILAMQQLRNDYSLTCPPLSIARYSFIQLSRLRRREVKENAQTSKR